MEHTSESQRWPSGGSNGAGGCAASQALSRSSRRRPVPWSTVSSWKPSWVPANEACRSPSMKVNWRPATLDQVSRWIVGSSLEAGWLCSLAVPAAQNLQACVCTSFRIMLLEYVALMEA